VLATASVSFVLALYDGNWAHDVKAMAAWRTA
jgi:hypothetical protein